MALKRIFFLPSRRPISLFTALSHRITRTSLYRYLSQRSLLQHRISNADCISGDVEIISSFHQLETHVRIQCSSHNFDNSGALKLFDIMLKSNPPPSVSSFNILLARVKRFRDYPFVFWIYRTSLDADILSPNVYTHGIIIDSCCGLGCLDLGFGVLGCMMKSGCWPNKTIFNTLVYGFYKSKKIFDAIHMLRRMFDMGYTADLITYSTMISYCFQNNFFDIGFGIFTKLLKDGITLDIITLNSLIHGLCEADKLVEATALVLRFPEMGFAPNDITYRTLINGYCRNNNAYTVELGFGVFGEMLKRGHCPNTIVYTSLVKGLCAINRIDEATALVLRFPEMGFAPNVITYGTLINGYCRNNNAYTVELGFGVFGEMLKRGHRPNTIVYTALVKGLCAINRVDEAGVLVEKMYSKLGCSPDVMTYNTLISGLCCVGDTQVALKLLRDMGNNKKIHWCKPNKFTYMTIIYSLCRLGEMNEALKVLEEMDANQSST